MIRKTLLAAAIALGLIATPALALNQFYHVQSGQWSIEGYTGEKNFCSAKSYWPNGSYVSLFNMRGSDKFSFIIHNEEWFMNGNVGEYYEGKMVFTGKIGSETGTAPFEYLDPQTIAFRGMTADFIESWIKYRTLEIVMPNDIQNLSIGLSGTSDATNAFVDCIEHLNN
jgi:hypothetical protein